MKITGSIITLNEENNIKDCIESMLTVCDEIIVVDSESNDKTVEISRSLGAKVYIQPYLGDGPQKAFGVQYASNDWILSIDADERLEQDMIDRIQSLKLSDPNTAYAFRRKNYVGNHWIKAAGFYPDYVTRLYNRTTSKYMDLKAHSKVIAPKKRKIKAHIKHFTYDSYSHWIERLSWFINRDARAYYSKGKRPSKIRPFTSGFAAFVQQFIVKGGIFQGADGMTVTLTSVMRAYMKYTILNDIYENEKLKKPFCGRG